MNPAPFLKWAGGKSQLLQQFEKFIPSDFNQYIEPFIGGGALFFHLYSKGRIKQATILDSNKELIDCYKAIKGNLQDLVECLSEHKVNHLKLREEYYYRIRNKVRNNLDIWNGLSVVKRSAITIYLNKTCFNGLYRVNRKNEFNVPVGGYRNPEIFKLGNLKAVNQALRVVKVIRAYDFSKCLQYAEKDDFVYLDPPYNPLNKTASFTSYTKNGFGQKEQIKLSEVYRKLSEKGCKIMLSNSDTDFIKNLYGGYRIETVKATRMINCKSAGRGKINEIVVMNY